MYIKLEKIRRLLCRDLNSDKDYNNFGVNLKFSAKDLSDKFSEDEYFSEALVNNSTNTTATTPPSPELSPATPKSEKLTHFGLLEKVEPVLGAYYKSLFDSQRKVDSENWRTEDVLSMSATEEETDDEDEDEEYEEEREMKENDPRRQKALLRRQQQLQQQTLQQQRQDRGVKMLRPLTKERFDMGCARFYSSNYRTSMHVTEAWEKSHKMILNAENFHSTDARNRATSAGAPREKASKNPFAHARTAQPSSTPGKLPKQSSELASEAPVRSNSDRDFAITRNPTSSDEVVPHNTGNEQISNSGKDSSHTTKDRRPNNKLLFNGFPSNSILEPDDYLVELEDATCVIKNREEKRMFYKSLAQCKTAAELKTLLEKSDQYKICGKNFIFDFGTLQTTASDAREIEGVVFKQLLSTSQPLRKISLLNTKTLGRNSLSVLLLHHPHVHSLDISGASALSRCDIAGLIEDFRGIQNFVARNINNVVTLSFKPLKQLTLKNFGTLTQLVLSECEKLKTFEISLPLLKRLTLTSNPSLVSLTLNTSSLTLLNLKGSPNISEKILDVVTPLTNLELLLLPKDPVAQYCSIFVVYVLTAAAEKATMLLERGVNIDYEGLCNQLEFLLTVKVDIEEAIKFGNFRLVNLWLRWRQICRDWDVIKDFRKRKEICENKNIMVVSCPNRKNQVVRVFQRVCL